MYQIDEISTFHRFHSGTGYSKLGSRNRLIKAVLLSLSGSRGDPVAGLGGLERRKREPGPKPPASHCSIHCSKKKLRSTRTDTVDANVLTTCLHGHQQGSEPPTLSHSHFVLTYLPRHLVPPSPPLPLLPPPSLSSPRLRL